MKMKVVQPANITGRKTIKVPLSQINGKAVWLGVKE